MLITRLAIIYSLTWARARPSTDTKGLSSSSTLWIGTGGHAEQKKMNIRANLLSTSLYGMNKIFSDINYVESKWIQIYSSIQLKLLCCCCCLSVVCGSISSTIEWSAFHWLPFLLSFSFSISFVIILKLIRATVSGCADVCQIWTVSASCSCVDWGASKRVRSVYKLKKK